MAIFYTQIPQNLRVRADNTRKEFSLVLIPGIPLRIHGPQGGYLFSVYADETGRFYRYRDKRWGDLRKIKAERITWEKPV